MTAASLLAFVLLPLLIHLATPFSYREILSIAGEAVITAIATGTVLVVLPMIIERCKALLQAHAMESDETNSTVDVLVPTAYSFPSAGTLLGLGFILFSAWYVGTPLSVTDYPSYIVMGALTAFGSMAVAIPFMLDFFGLPADQFQLYLLGSVVTARVATGLAALHGFTVTLLVAAAVLKRLKWLQLLQAIATHLAVTAGVMFLANSTLSSLIPYEYKGVKTFESMQAMGQPPETQRLEDVAPLNSSDVDKSRLTVIRERGSLRVGYLANSLPFVFQNDNGALVGFDMEIVNKLARDLELRLDVVFIKNHKEIPAMLADGRVDIVIGGHIITPMLALDIAFSTPYTFHTAAFIIPDARRDDFKTIAKINSHEKLRLGMKSTAYYSKHIQGKFPQAIIVPVASPREYLTAKHTDMDGFVFSAEAGSAWTMLYPQFSTVVPEGLLFKAPVAFYLPKEEEDYCRFIDTWLTLKKENGFLDRVYTHWILGENPKEKKPRWSVIHNVLGW